MDVVSPVFTELYPRTIDLTTQRASAVGYFDVTSNGYVHAFLNASAPSSYGEFAPVFNFDQATNKITGVVNYYGQPSATRARAARVDITDINALTGTPGTEGSVIKVKYVLIQSGADRTFFDEIFTYKSPRP